MMCRILFLMSFVSLSCYLGTFLLKSTSWQMVRHDYDDFAIRNAQYPMCYEKLTPPALNVPLRPACDADV